MINKYILAALKLRNKSEILLSAKPDIRKREKIIKYSFITVKEFVIFDYAIENKRVIIKESISLDKIQSVSLAMERITNVDDPLFEINALKKPVIRINGAEKSYSIILWGIDVAWSLERKIENFTNLLKQENPMAEISINFKKDDMSEAYSEMMFGEMDIQKKKRLKVIMAILVLVFSLLFWRALLSTVA